MAINETKLDSTERDGEIYIPGHDIVRKDRTSCGRGIALYIKCMLTL